MTMWVDSNYDRLEPFLIQTGREDEEYALVLRFIRSDKDGNVLDSVTIETAFVSSDRSDHAEQVELLASMNIFHAGLLATGSVYNTNGEKIGEVNWNHLIILNHNFHEPKALH